MAWPIGNAELAVVDSTGVEHARVNEKANYKTTTDNANARQVVHMRACPTPTVSATAILRSPPGKHRHRLTL